MTRQYETVIGLEVHVELATKTKIFCSCSTQFGGAPNTHTCPVCTGMPGSLPALNRQVVEYAMAIGLATNCENANLTARIISIRTIRRITRYPSCICRLQETDMWRSKQGILRKKFASMRCTWKKTQEN